MNPQNVTTWLDPGMVAGYADGTGLLGAEPRILEELRPGMARWSMLDVGVGGGRTTPHFAPAVADYTGVDLSPAMVAHCRRTQGYGSYRFEVVDVRELSMLGTHRFDFVLFSFNGLDYLDHPDRLRALSQIHAVCRPGALFCFSTHNILALSNVMRLRDQYNKHPVWLWRNLGNWLRWRQRHARHVAQVVAARPDWAVVNDGAHECRLETYYVRPSAQLAQLEPAFGDVRVFAFSGEELDRNQLENAKDGWLYFLCRAR